MVDIEYIKKVKKQVKEDKKKGLIIFSSEIRKPIKKKKIDMDF